ncbi:MAG: helix-turn-helix transcriptional regulator [Candidatus Latescibacterota bacterium]
MSFAKMLREARSRAGLSQSALAQRVSTSRRPGGVWPTYIGQIEKGEKVPSDEVCLELAGILDLPPEEVLLSAYQARAECKEARHLFAQMQRILADPRARQLAEDGAVPGPEVLELLQDPEVRAALGDPDLRAALRDPDWRAAMARSCQCADRRPMLALLNRLEGLSARQWKGLMTMLEGMGV